jgi:dTDP-4-dehydrorhamnose reductase
MHYAILGASGQLAADLGDQLSSSVRRLTRKEADLTRPETLRTLLEAPRPDVVFNCAAYNFVDRAETEPSAAFAVNALGVRDLALICRELDCTLVHFSTDYVFGLDETRQAPYSELDAPGPLSVYGSSKLAGEHFVRSVCRKHFVVRTCGLYGLKGSGGKGDSFPEKILRLAREGRPIRVVADQRCTPSYTADVATAAITLVQTGRFGLYHLTNSGSCSWYEFAREILAIQSLDANLTAISTRDFAAAARRPAYSVLEMRACQSAGLSALRPWKLALAAYLQARRMNSIDLKNG